VLFPDPNVPNSDIIFNFFFSYNNSIFSLKFEFISIQYDPKM